MKQKDIALIIVSAFISAVFAVVLSKFVIAPPQNQHQRVEVVDKISPDFKTPDKLFTSDSINPTRTITVKPGDNTNPFNNANQ